MIKFSQEKALFLHELLIEETGGSAGVRDYGLLDSALESAYATFDGADLYPSIEDKAAKIGYSLISNHSFVDGNKRIGMFVMICFLEVNGLRVNATNDDVICAGLAVASGSMNYDRFKEWIIKITR